MKNNILIIPLLFTLTNNSQHNFSQDFIREYSYNCSAEDLGLLTYLNSCSQNSFSEETYSNNLPRIYLPDIPIVPNMSIPYYSQKQFTNNFFSNCGANIITNSIGNCGFTAISELLSYYDVYWNDNIIPNSYNSLPVTLTSNDDNNSIYQSPGIKNNSIYTSTNQTSESIHDFIDTCISNKEDSFLGLLLSFAKENGYYGENTTLTSLGVNYPMMVSILEKYISYLNLEGISLISEGINAELGITSSYLRNKIISQISKGNPVIVGGNYHVCIAYDYDYENDIIYGDMGYGLSLYSHFNLDAYWGAEGVADYYYFSFDESIQHTHNNKYVSGLEYFCSCELISHEHHYVYESHNSTLHYKQCICSLFSFTENHAFTHSEFIGIKEYAVCGQCGFSKLISNEIIPGI